MTQPSVNITELDGSLGVLPPTEGALPVYMGPSSQGPIDTPAAWGRVADLVSTYGIGPTVEAAALELVREGRPVIFIRTGQTVAGDEGTLDDADFAGTSTVTLDTAEPDDDFDIEILFLTGGTIGVAGITYQVSLDGGFNYGAVTALGTATEIIVPGTGGVNFDFGAGTVVAGDILRTRTTAPNWNSTELTAALTALSKSILTWEIVNVIGPLDAAGFDALDLAVAGMATSGRYRAWIGHTRMPNLAESESAYKTALDTIFSSKSTVRGMLCAGAARTISAVNGIYPRRPSLFRVSARQCVVDHEVNIAEIDLGALDGISIRDVNGNPDEHDESANPGLDDSRFCVLRTHEGYPGVYVNRARLFSSDTSDFQLMPHRRVLNLAHTALRAYFQRRLNKPIRVKKDTGFIREEDALEIEAGARRAMASLLLAKPKASGIDFSLSRVDNILSTKTLTGDARVIPFGYPETINLAVGFKNPALLVQAA